MKRRYIAAGAIFYIAAAAVYLQGRVSWPVVALVGLAALTLVGAHAFDGVSVGPLEVDENGEDDS